jgi:hypothetical protein
MQVQATSPHASPRNSFALQEIDGVNRDEALASQVLPSRLQQVVVEKAEPSDAKELRI